MPSQTCILRLAYDGSAHQIGMSIWHLTRVSDLFSREKNIPGGNRTSLVSFVKFTRIAEKILRGFFLLCSKEAEIDDELKVEARTKARKGQKVVEQDKRVRKRQKRLKTE